MEPATITLMEPATTRFFNIPELVAHLTQYLDQPGISRLMQTSRQLHALCAPSHYYKVLACYEPCRSNLFEYTESLLAFANNVHFVRQMYFRRQDVVYYVNCVVAFLNTPVTQQNTSAVTTIENQPAITQPVWLAPADPRNCTVFPIPPMTMLTKLEVDLVEIPYLESCTYYMPSYRDPKATITQVCWIMDSNPHLLNLSLNKATIKDRRDAHILIRSISGLQRLQTLSVEVIRWEDSEGRVPEVDFDIFFSCSSTLRELNLVSYEEDQTNSFDFTDEYNSLPPGTMQAWEKSDEECGLVVVTPRRQGPLQYLKQLSLGRLDEGFTEEDVRSILQHCPNLTALVLPPIANISDVQGLAERIARWCPKLNDVSNHGFGGGGEVTRQLMVWILKALPSQQATRFFCRGISAFTVHGLDDLRPIFRRHSSMLREILLNNCRNIDSKTVQAILVECEALEELTMLCPIYSNQQLPYLDLDDAIEFPWACTRMQDLSLIVAIPDQPLHHLTDDVVPYYNRPLPTALSPEETAQFQKLESFYRQLGALTQLKRLDLRAIYFDPAGNRAPSQDFTAHSFPGLFCLGRVESGRLGYLQLLGGLSKLKILAGSTCLMTAENEVTVGMEEVQWIDKHLPALERVQFSSSKKSSEPLCWLMKARRQKGQGISLFL